jgi:predicted metal-binding membrane protein
MHETDSADAPERSHRGWAINGVRLAYLGLASAIGVAPLRIPVPLILLTGAAWAVMLHHAIHMSAPMGPAGRGVLDDIQMFGNEASLGGLGAFVAVWTVMMVAMMLPAVAPMILTFAAAQARRDRNNVVVPTWMFVVGYILVWAYAGFVVYLFLHTGKDLVEYLAWLETGAWAPLALGITLTLAGLYQFTPLKQRGLRYCRSPSAFLRLHWHEDWENAALAMGMSHGLYCLVCCWALFSVMVAAGGMMSVAWMLVMTLVLFAEKVLPDGLRIRLAVAVGLIALGLLVGTDAVQLGS